VITYLSFPAQIDGNVRASALTASLAGHLRSGSTSSPILMPF
jgi:hypothetical protein